MLQQPLNLSKEPQPPDPDSDPDFTPQDHLQGPGCLGSPASLLPFLTAQASSILSLASASGGSQQAEFQSLLALGGGLSSASSPTGSNFTPSVSTTVTSASGGSQHSGFPTLLALGGGLSSASPPVGGILTPSVSSTSQASFPLMTTLGAGLPSVSPMGGIPLVSASALGGIPTASAMDLPSPASSLSEARLLPAADYCSLAGLELGNGWKVVGLTYLHPTQQQQQQQQHAPPFHSQASVSPQTAVPVTSGLCSQESSTASTTTASGSPILSASGSGPTPSTFVTAGALHPNGLNSSGLNPNGLDPNGLSSTGISPSSLVLGSLTPSGAVDASSTGCGGVLSPPAAVLPSSSHSVPGQWRVVGLTSLSPGASSAVDLTCPGPNPVALSKRVGPHDASAGGGVEDEAVDVPVTSVSMEALCGAVDLSMGDARGRQSDSQCHKASVNTAEDMACSPPTTNPCSPSHDTSGLHDSSYTPSLSQSHSLYNASSSQSHNNSSLHNCSLDTHRQQKKQNGASSSSITSRDEAVNNSHHHHQDKPSSHFAGIQSTAAISPLVTNRSVCSGASGSSSSVASGLNLSLNLPSLAEVAAGTSEWKIAGLTTLVPQPPLSSSLLDVASTKAHTVVSTSTTSSTSVTTTTTSTASATTTTTSISPAKKLSLNGIGGGGGCGGGIGSGGGGEWKVVGVTSLTSPALSVHSPPIVVSSSLSSSSSTTSTNTTSLSPLQMMASSAPALLPPPPPACSTMLPIPLPLPPLSPVLADQDMVWKVVGVVPLPQQPGAAATESLPDNSLNNSSSTVPPSMDTPLLNGTNAQSSVLNLTTTRPSSSSIAPPPPPTLEQQHMQQPYSCSANSGGGGVPLPTHSSHRLDDSLGPLSVTSVSPGKECTKTSGLKPPGNPTQSMGIDLTTARRCSEQRRHQHQREEEKRHPLGFLKNCSNRFKNAVLKRNTVSTMLELKRAYQSMDKQQKEAGFVEGIRSNGGAKPVIKDLMYYVLKQMTKSAKHKTTVELDDDDYYYDDEEDSDDMNIPSTLCQNTSSKRKKQASLKTGGVGQKHGSRQKMYRTRNPPSYPRHRLQDRPAPPRSQAVSDDQIALSLAYRSQIECEMDDSFSSASPPLSLSLSQTHSPYQLDKVGNISLTVPGEKQQNQSFLDGPLKAIKTEDGHFAVNVIEGFEHDSDRSFDSDAAVNLTSVDPWGVCTTDSLADLPDPDIMATDNGHSKVQSSSRKRKLTTPRKMIQ